MITKFFNAISLRWKMFLTTGSISLFALVVFGAIFTVTDFYSYTEQSLQNTVEIANFIGNDNGFTVSGRVYESAQQSLYEILSSYEYITHGAIFLGKQDKLDTEGSLFAFYDHDRQGNFDTLGFDVPQAEVVQAAALSTQDQYLIHLLDSGHEILYFDPNKRRFSHNYLMVAYQNPDIPKYVKASENTLSFPDKYLEIFWQKGYMEVYVPIKDEDDGVIGTAYVRSDIGHFWTRLRSGGITFLAITLVTMVGVFVVTLWMQQFIYKPILAFTQQANQISSSQNYKIRFETQNRDEIGDLQKAFNNMLDTLEKQREDLVQERNKAQESALAKERFLANMTHELRTPIHGIIGSADLMAQTTTLKNKQAEYLEVVRDSAKDLLQIINDLLDQSKINAGMMQLEEKVFSPVSVIGKTLRNQKVKIEEKGLTTHMDIADNVPQMAIGDELRFKQVLLNLISNAIKFTQNGSVTVGLRLKHETDTAVVLECSVKDTGIGIEPEKQEMVFNLFSQASSDTTRKYGGTGLGLSISKSLAKLQGGDIKLESKLNEGSTFFYEVPFKKVPKSQYGQGQAVMDAQEQDQQADSGNGQYRLLVAEDNETNQKLVRAMLNHYGYQFDLAADGREALALLQKNTYDLALLDVHMPELDGYDTTKAIREHSEPSIRGLPIVAMTALALKGEAEKCIAKGMNDYISKPFKKRQLHEKIQKVLQENIVKA